MAIRLLTRIAALTLVAGLLVACSGLRIGGTRGSGTVTTEERPVSGFSAVSISGIGRVIIEQGGAESLRITADDNLIPLITSDVRDGTLYIDIKPWTGITAATELTYHITLKDLRAIDLSGAANVEARGITGDYLAISSSGAGDITAAGTVEEQVIDLSGAGSYDGEHLESRRAHVTTSGASSVIVDASETLDVEISGVGSVTYIGTPRVTQDISGMGTVRQQ